MVCCGIISVSRTFFAISKTFIERVLKLATVQECQLNLTETNINDSLAKYIDEILDD